MFLKYYYNGIKIKIKKINYKEIKNSSMPTTYENENWMSQKWFHSCY